MKKKNIWIGIVVLSVLLVIQFLQSCSFDVYDVHSEAPASSFIHVVSQDGHFDYYDDSNHLAYAADKGYASKIVEREGNIEVEKYFDIYGNPIKQSMGYYQLKNIYDSNNRIIQIEYLDMDGNRIINSSGYSIVKKEYDSLGNVVKELYFDAKEIPVLNNAKYHGILREYDSSGLCNKLTFIDVDQKSTIISTGYTSQYRTYYPNGKLETEIYLDLEDNPIVMMNGNCGVKYSYDAYGRVDTLTTIDSQKRPCLNTSGYGIKKSIYYKNNSIKAELYYDLDGNPISLSNGQYGIFYKENREPVYLNTSNRQMFKLDSFLYNHPLIVIECAFLLIVLSLVVPNSIRLLLLLLYIGFILYMTLFVRETQIVQSNYPLFWSFRLFLNNASTRKEVLLNILLFVPLGYLVSFRKNKMWILYSIGLSILVELSQLIFSLGMFEYDDILTNSMGVILGYFLGMIISKMTESE